MNKKIQKGLKLLAISLTIGALSIPVIAKPALQKIEAFLNPTLTYMLDGEEVMDGVDAITYKDTTYISLAELNKALGHEISYDNGVITIKTPEATVARTGGTTKEAGTLPEYMTIEKALIKEVDLENGKVTILPEGQEDDMMNYIILNIDPETVSVRHEFLKIALNADALVPGYQVSVKHSPIMQPSLPPQTPAFEIVILGGQEFPLIPMEDLSPAQKVETIESATIKEVDREGMQVTILPAGKEDTVYNYVVLNLNDETSIHHEKNKMMYKIDMLEEGMKITVKHSPMMTMSIPPQTPAVEIIVLADQGK